jgi:hypothetical protein
LMLDPNSLQSASWLRTNVSRTTCYVSARVAIVLFVLCCPNSQLCFKLWCALSTGDYLTIWKWIPPLGR